MATSNISIIYVNRRSSVDVNFDRHLQRVSAVPAFAYVADIYADDSVEIQNAAYETVFVSETLLNTKAGREIFRLANEVWTGTIDSHNRQDLPLRCIKGQGAEQPTVVDFDDRVFSFFQFLFQELGLSKELVDAFVAPAEPFRHLVLSAYKADAGKETFFSGAAVRTGKSITLVLDGTEQGQFRHLSLSKDEAGWAWETDGQTVKELRTEEDYAQFQADIRQLRAADVQADMFVVPNRKDRLIFAEFDELDHHWVERHNALVDQLGLPECYKYRDGDLPVEIWIAGQGSDDWGAHGVPALFGMEGEVHFPYSIPARLLSKVTEGGAIFGTINGKTIKLVANQIGYRYRRFGKFEEVVAKVTTPRKA